MKKLLKIIFILLTVYISYLAVDFYFTFKEVTTNRKVEIPLNGKTELIFSSAQPFINLSGVGIKINNFTEKNENFEVNHLEPLILKYNIFTTALSLSYNGPSNITYGGKKYTAKIDVNYLIDFNFTFSSLANIIHNYESIIKHVKLFRVKQNKIEIKNNLDKAIFLSEKSNLQLITDLSNISSINDLIDNPPKNYSIISSLNISNTQESNKKFPIGVLYGFLSNIDFNGNLMLDLDSNAKKINFKNPLDNSKIVFICKKCTSSLLDIEIDSEIDFRNKKKKIYIDSSLKFKDGFIKLAPKWYKNAINIILSFNKQSRYYIPRIKNVLPVIEKDEEFLFKLSSSHQFARNYINFDLDNLIIISSSGPGIMMNGKYNLDNKFNYVLLSEVVIKKYKNVTDYLGDYIQKIFSKNHVIDQDVVDIYNHTNHNLLKKMSDFPNSKSDDLKLTIDINSTENKYKIGSFSKNELLNEYFKSKTQTILDKAIANQSPEKFIEKIAPNVSKELKSLLPKNKKISDRLWKKLLK